MLRKLLVPVVLAAVVLVGSGVWAGNPNPGVLPPSSHAFGTTYGDLAGAWWNWAVCFPSEENPIVDDTGEDGANGQSGKVWFLAGTFGGDAERTLTVPAGKALFFPLVTYVFWNPEDATTEEELRALAASNTDLTSVLECTVDGVALQGLFGYRAASPEGGFVLHVPEDSILTEWGYAPGDRDPAVADGYWLLLAPLSAGQHAIQFAAAAGDFSLDVTYNLAVVGGKPAAVPEPSALVLAGFGLLGLIAYGSRRRRRRIR